MPPPTRPQSSAPSAARTAQAKPGLSVRLEKLRAFYGEAEQVKGIDLDFRANEVTAIIGPSGCGKSTMIRCINRMHEEIPGARAEGRVLLDELDVYDSGVDVVAVRRAIGMVFQKPNPFPTMSIFDNVAAGLRLSARGRGDLRPKVEAALRRAVSTLGDRSPRPRELSRRPEATLSKIDIVGKGLGFWKTIPIARRTETTSTSGP
jgi:phosphate transport system ATP-binding protein